MTAGRQEVLEDVMGVRRGRGVVGVELLDLTLQFGDIEDLVRGRSRRVWASLVLEPSACCRGDDPRLLSEPFMNPPYCFRNKCSGT